MKNSHDVTIRKCITEVISCNYVMMIITLHTSTFLDNSKYRGTVYRNRFNLTVFVRTLVRIKQLKRCYLNCSYILFFLEINKILFLNVHLIFLFPCVSVKHHFSIKYYINYPLSHIEYNFKNNFDLNFF